MNSKQIKVGLAARAIERLDEIAEENGMSRSAYARLVLINHIRQEGRDDEWKKR